MLPIEEINIPGFGPRVQEDKDSYAVCYLKANLDDLEQKAELERIETEGLRGKEIVIIQRQNFTFMDKMFFVVTYLKRRAS